MNNLRSRLTMLGTSTIAASAVLGSAAIAHAGTLTFDYRGTVTSDNISLNNFDGLVDFGDIEGALGIDPNSSDLADTIAGSFTTSDDPNQYLDGDLEIDGDFALGLLGFTADGFEDQLADALGILSPGTPSSLDDVLALLDITMSGTGQLVTSGGVLEFAATYSSDFDNMQLSFLPANASLIDNCLSELCTVNSDLDFQVDLDLFSGFLPSMEIASGSLALAVETTPREQTTQESVPEPAMVLGLLASSGWVVARRRKAA